MLVARVLLVAIALIVPLVEAGGTPPAGTYPYLIGFRTLPAGASYQGEPIASANAALGFVVVQAHDPAALGAHARADPNVRYVRYDDPAGYHASAMPNDPMAPMQWAWARVNATGAWDATSGSASIVVAVLDSGIERTHPDLASGRILTGYDFVNKDSDPADDCGHGTHVSGTVGAISGNGAGVAGMAQVSILPVKVLNSYCAGSFSAVASGIQYAADHGARVISLSLGCGVSCYDQATADAISYAWSKGALVVVAAGNEGPCDNCIQFPANVPHALAVGCTDENDNICPFSSRGPNMIVAPGHNILSTYLGGSYAWNNGTSMSAPHVSGAAALALSADPALTNAQLLSLLQSTSIDLGAAGVDGTFGYGRLDAGALVAAARSLAPATPAHAVAISPPSSALTIKAGGSVTYALSVTNVGTSSDTYALSMNGAAQGWRSSLSATSVTLAPGASALVKLTVKAPRSAATGASLGVTVAAGSQADASASARAATLTTVG